MSWFCGSPPQHSTEIVADNTQSVRWRIDDDRDRISYIDYTAQTTSTGITDKRCTDCTTTTTITVTITTTTTSYYWHLCSVLRCLSFILLYGQTMYTHISTQQYVNTNASAAEPATTLRHYIHSASVITSLFLTSYTSCFWSRQKQRQSIQVASLPTASAQLPISPGLRTKTIKYLPWQRCQRHPCCSRVNAAATATRLP